MQVGFKTLASPRDPFMIFVLVSINVFADEYPIGTPVNRQTLSASNSKTCASGRKPSNTSSGYIFTYIKIYMRISIDRMGE